MIIKASWVGTALFAVTAIAAAIDPHVFAGVALAVSLVLFLVGCVIFFAAFLYAVGRSREVEIGIGGLYFLAGTAPRPVQLHLLGSLGTEVVVAFATASARPFTSLAFGMLVPVYGLGSYADVHPLLARPLVALLRSEVWPFLGLCGLWGARHGTFAPRVTT